jgi:RHS repeat-associated protein
MNRSCSSERVHAHLTYTSPGYDALYRLTSASYPNGDSVSYDYDAVGNRTSLTVNGNATTNTFDAADRLTTSGTTTYGYDANGNQTSKTIGGVTTTYAYDSLNRLTTVTGGTSYAYNGDGLRTSKTIGGVTTSFTWDPTGLGTVISDGDSYLWGLGLIGRITSGGTRTYAHQDGLGSTRLITDSSGAVVGTTAYDAFGATRSSTGVQYRFGYTGEQLDAETGFVYLRARYLDPGQRRFLTKDPFGGFRADPTSHHRYSYVGNNPIILVDPLGEFGVLAAVGVGAVVGAVAGAVTSVVVQTVQNGGDITAVDGSDVVAAAVTGAAAGALAPVLATSPAGAVALGGFANVGQYVASQWLNDDPITMGGAASSAITGAVAGRIAGPVKPFRSTYYDDWGLGGEYFKYQADWDYLRGEVAQNVASAASLRNALAACVSAFDVSGWLP